MNEKAYVAFYWDQENVPNNTITYLNYSFFLKKMFMFHFHFILCLF